VVIALAGLISRLNDESTTAATSQDLAVVDGVSSGLLTPTDVFAQFAGQQRTLHPCSQTGQLL
jgi:hypothetical protein